MAVDGDLAAVATGAMARAPRISLAWSNINKTLPCRAILFDARCIMRSPEEAAAPGALKRKDVGLDLRKPENMIAEGRVKDMLRSEIREELTRRGLSAVGKPWEIKDRLLQSIEAEASAAPPESTDAPPTPPPPPPSAKIDTGPSGSAADKRAAYAAKLRARTGGSMLADGTIAASDPKPGARVLAPDERPVDPDAPAVAGMSWHLQPGVRDLLTYCDMRNIYRVLLPYDVEDDEAGYAQAAQLARSLQVPEWHHVLSRDEVAATRRGESAVLAALCGSLELANSSNLMLVSDESAPLRAAKAAGVFSCFFLKRLPGAPTRRPADFYAGDMTGLQHAIEDINGVTFRDSNTEIRTKFGVYQT